MRHDGTLVIKCKPIVRTILATELLIGHLEPSHEFFQVSVPYHTFVINYKYTESLIKVQSYLFFHLDDQRKELYLPYLPNCDRLGRVCLGTDKFSCDLEDIPKKVIDRFWQSSFNDNLLSARYFYRKAWSTSAGFGTLAWCGMLAHLSKNPNFWQEVGLVKMDDIDIQSIPWGVGW